MSGDLNKAAHCYVGYNENNPVCFFAVLHFPHPASDKFKRGHRLVVLPDYQGVGIGHRFSTDIAEYYKQQGFRFIITSSTKSLYKQRARDPRWVVTSKCRKHAHMGLNNKGSQNKMTYSYEYIGSKNTTSYH